MPAELSELFRLDGRVAVITGGGGMLGEQHAAVHDQQPARVLEDRHVPADLTETAKRDDAQAATAKRGRRGEVRVRVAHALVPSR